MSYLITSRNGLGDGIYARPFVREFAKRGETWVATAWPELFSDLGVHCVQPETCLAVHQRNIARHNGTTWSNLPEAPQLIALKYAWRAMRRNSILAEMEKNAGIRLDAVALDLPPLPASPVQRDNVAVVRLTIARTDWINRGRDPLAGYVSSAARMLMDAGYHVVTVAYLQDGLEHAAETVPAHQRFEHGELSTLELLALVANAAVVVGGPSWIIPACIATRTPCIVIAGGNGAQNSPAALVDARLGATWVQWLLPDRYCMCKQRTHQCDKRISDFEQRFQREMPACVTDLALS